MIIAGIDPGLTTGVALIAWNGKDDPAPPALEYSQIPFPELPAYIKALCTQVDVLAVERFNISGRTLSASRQYEALYAIGGIMFLADLNGAVHLRLQNPADAKNAYSNETLDALGWKVKGRHAKDALRHALLATHARKAYIGEYDADSDG